MSLLTVRGLTAGYGNIDVLRDIDIDVAKGRVTAVLGANGAGKTTLLRAITGMIRRRGEITFKGARIDELGTANIARSGIAHVPDGRGTFGPLTVEENLKLGAITRRKTPDVAADFERIYQYFPKLAERRRQQAGTLSGGEQQMLAIGRALMLRPKLLVLDEPSFGLAPLIVDEIFRLLRRLQSEEGTSLLLVEQNASRALDLADHACLLETGRVVVTGLPSDLRRDESVRRAYFGG